MTTAPHRIRSGSTPAWRQALLTIGLLAASIAAVAFTATYAWGEIQRVAGAFGFDL